MKWCCRKALTSSLFFLLLLGCALFWLRPASAAPSVQQKPPETIPVWVYDAESFAFWRDAQGNYQGLYPRLAAMLHERYGYNVQIRPIDAEEMDRRFANDDYGLYAGVIRTDDLARNRILSSRLFDNEVVAASTTQRIYKPEDLHNSRVLFLRDDATQDRVQQRYPNLKFRELRRVENGEEAFRLLSDGQADFYINDASEMDNTARYYQLSLPFPGLRITRVFAFSPALHTMRDDINQLINDEYRSGKMRQLILDNKRQFLLSRVTISDTERHWLAQNKLDVWLPANENYAPLIWHDRQGYHGSAIDMINDMRDLLHVDVNVHYIDNYYESLQSQNWPVRLVNVIAPPDRSQLPGMIGPVVSWHNVYYNRIGQPFIWDEDQIRHQRIGVIKGSFSQFYLQQRYASEITLVTFGTHEQLISGIENDRVDYILGDLSSLESALRGNELFRGVLKVAGITRSELQMGPWADSAHPLHNLLSQVHRLSGYRTLSEGSDEPPHFSGLTRNTLKIISVLLLITAIFSLCLLVIMWRHMRQNRIVNRNIVKVLEKVNRAHDDETGSHIQRVAKYCGLLGRALKLPRRTVRDIENFASLHDVGKIAVPERILRKEGPLTEDEFEEMKLHTLKGWRIIQGLSLGPVAENIIHFHHEKWDGSGYPDGLRGEQIPLEARILALADVYDALRQKRIYKPSFTHEQAMQIIEAGSGRHFDPRLVALFRQQQHLFARIFDTLAD
ncbi:HD domain-containing phosphohydrolase [Citrobacter sp. MNAZ 1397]|uniref:HD domain-containing phosphohydrolase n=1 Tax=Citrobacter sp. MNAZ 1397 TaxID=2911205 RepID=UPI002025C595|nr:HD domain-containing phosphohydrolase [Citrobacter sp. MNAZ 1397]MCL9671671.1 transporter substrate-binding domain-containing protein [Citrobacter sp. MNAZ 1397]